MGTEFYNGRRLSCEGHLCTVRFYGEVAGTKGEWVGVEWDEASRGKHSGEHDGVKYFECINQSSNAGSFIRPSRPFDSPRNVVTAVHAKYASDVKFNDNIVTIDKSDASVRVSGKEVEEVGFDKIRRQLANLKALRIVLLDGLCVSRPEARGQDAGLAHPEHDFGHTCPEITELDLSRNLFEEWSEVFAIYRQLDNLQSLKVNGNRFRRIVVPEKGAIPARPDITALSLDETSMTWEQICQIALSMGNVRFLSARANGFRSLSAFDFPARCTSITLDHNQIEAISNLSPLTKLSVLSTLKLKNNQISQVYCDKTQNASGNTSLTFSKTLTEVDLSANRISDWGFINELVQVFPGLISLRTSRNPLYKNMLDAEGRPLAEDDGHLLTIARIGQLQRLNFSPVTPKERLNADTYYLSRITTELSKIPPERTAEVLSKHPRYSELCELYGTPDINRQAVPDVNPNTLAARLIHISVRLSVLVAAKSNLADSSSHTFTVKVPRSLHIYGLLSLLARRLALEPMSLQLVWETGEINSVANVVAEEQMDDGHLAADHLSEETGVHLVSREELLAPKTRAIGSWIDTSEAQIRIEFDENYKARRKSS